MKKILALLLLVALFVLPACGGKSVEVAATKQSAIDALVELDKEFFDVFERYIPRFNDPASVRVTNVIYIDTEKYGDFFLAKVNARNGFGGITSTDYYMSKGFFGTAEDVTRMPFDKSTAITLRMSQKMMSPDYFDIEAINAAVKEFLEENGLS